MKILVCSDSHGDYPRLFRAHEAAGPVDLTLHLGDGADDARLLQEVLHVPVLAVAGNCDHGSPLPKELLLDLEGERVLLTHGSDYFVKAGLSRLTARGEALNAGVVLFGHTHLPFLATAGGTLLLNPGPLGQGDYALLTLAAGEPPAAELRTLPSA